MTARERIALEPDEPSTESPSGEDWFRVGNNGLYPSVSRPVADAREEIPSLLRELRRTVEGIAEDREPQTALHALLLLGEPLTVYQIAYLLSTEAATIRWTLEMLEENNLVFRFDNDHGLEFFALYTEPLV